MVSFAGYDMPLQYPDLTIKDSSIHTRRHASIFDVSHMLQTHIVGKDRVSFIESLTTADIQGLVENSGTLSVFTNEKGGIKDDLIITKTNHDFIYMVTNAGCIDKDLPYLQECAAKWRSNGKDVDIKVLDGRGLIAVQGNFLLFSFEFLMFVTHDVIMLKLIIGPEMTSILQPETDIDLSKLTFMRSTIGKVFGIDNCRVTRCGYTGEDGVEISVDAKSAAILVERILESKVCLKCFFIRFYFYDPMIRTQNRFFFSTSNFIFVDNCCIAKRRREAMDFPGATKIMNQLINKNWPKRRVGLVSDPGRVPRGEGIYPY
uniref:Aminomethyltransferase, mitochondrial n=1 Tax=Heterorhabditis bacteriophora TaxID=37862 RepID=A0A1I7XK54_HETBA